MYSRLRLYGRRVSGSGSTHCTPRWGSGVGTLGMGSGLAGTARRVIMASIVVVAVGAFHPCGM